MLELKNITIALSQTGRELISGFSFTLNRGEKAVIIGEEGNGKSTLLQYIYSPQLTESYCQCSGEIITKGKLGYLPQMLDPALAGLTLEQFFNGADFFNDAALFYQLDLLPEHFTSQQTLGTLSGGEKVKVQLAKILMGQPDILLLDEPTNDLDIETLEWLEGFIRRSRLPILFVSHDETLIERTANIVIHLEQLRKKTRPRATVARCGYREYLKSRGAAFEKQEQVARKQRSDHEKQMERWQQIYNRVDHEQSVISRQNPQGGRLLKKKMKSVLAQGRRLERESEDFLEIPETEDAIITKFSPEISLPKGKVVLDFTLPLLQTGGKTLARDISLFVAGGQHVGIVGKNGVGKSTLLAAVWQELAPRRDIIPALMPQNYREKLDYSLTPVEYLAANYSKEDMTKARTFMGNMRFTAEEMTGKIGNLSGGQKAKILFLDMVLQNANVLVLDEPTRNFSPLSSPVVRQALKEFGGAIISISHDRKYLEQVCDVVYQLTPEGLAAWQQP